jgi:guanine deaminase
MTTLTTTDAESLRMSIDLSGRALDDQGKTPFGAILVLNDEVVSEGTSSVIELFDPSAHAEVMALRNAARKLQRHLLPGSVLYSSNEPCPMCLTAYYWAQVSRLVFGATHSRPKRHFKRRASQHDWCRRMNGPIFRQGVDLFH